jgi:hypothetical protein
MKKITLFFIAYFAYFLSFSQEKNILFFGNSITASGIPQILQELAESKGRTIYTEQHWGGQLLYEYVQDSGTMHATTQKIQEKAWDFIVLQENSMVSGFYPGWTEGYFEYYAYNAAQILNNIIRNNTNCGETVFFMTYGYLNGDQQNFPGTDTYEKQQNRIQRNYMLLADSTSSMTAPVGLVWQQVRKEQSWGEELYMPGDHHPSELGSYLAACVFYTSLFRSEVSGSVYYANLDSTKARYIQQISDSIVLNYLKDWNIGINDVIATFNESITDFSVTFNSESQSPYLQHFWDFGDGNTSSMPNPVHTYAQSGIFDVTHRVSNLCGTEEQLQSQVNITSTNTTEIPANELRVFPTLVKDNIFLESDNLLEGTVNIYDISGKKIMTKSIYKTISSLLDLSFFKNGLYIFEFISKTRSSRFKITKY